MNIMAEEQTEIDLGVKKYSILYPKLKFGGHIVRNFQHFVKKILRVVINSHYYY